MKLTEAFKGMLAPPITSITYKINTFVYLPTHNDSPNHLEPTNVVPDNRKAPPLDGGQWTKFNGMLALKHDIRLTKFYELLIITELKGDTALYLNKFYNHITMCCNVVTRLQEDYIPNYQSIKRHSCLKNTSSQILITLPFIGMLIYKLCL